MEMRFSSKEELFLADEIKNLQQKGVIKESQHEEGEFISPIFLMSKSEDSFGGHVRKYQTPFWTLEKWQKVKNQCNTFDFCFDHLILTTLNFSLKRK